MLGWSTVSAMLQISAFAYLLTYSSVDLALTPLFVQHMQLLALGEVLSVLALLARPRRRGRVCEALLRH